MELPPVPETPNFESLIKCLREGEEDEFLKDIDVFVGQHSAVDLTELFRTVGDITKETLLNAAVKRDLVMAVERMLSLGADVNFGDSKTPIEWACMFGSWRSLDLLLNSEKIDEHKKELLCIVVMQSGNDKENYHNCLQLLLKWKNICIDEQDSNGFSALHTAAYVKNLPAIKELLKGGAYIGIKDKFDEYALQKIDPKVLKEHLDGCISSTGWNLNRNNEADLKIGFDYKNLIPTFAKKGKNGNDNEVDNYKSEMDPIKFIAQSDDLRHLIGHPLIASFLFLKWNQVAHFFYWNFFFSALFSVATVTYIMLCYKGETSGIFYYIIYGASICFLLYIIVREVIQLYLLKSMYMKNWENYFEVLLIIFTSIVLATNKDSFVEYHRIIAAATILLIAIEIFILVGSLPFWSFSTHYKMLITVTMTYLESLCLYAIILLAFSLSFFTLLRPESLQSMTAENSSTNDCNDTFSDSKLNKFCSIGSSIMKTIVMSTGEFEAANMDFKENIWSPILFLIFLFLIPIVLFNLLNALAISDTQLIKSEAELTDAIHRMKILTRFESILMRQKTFSCQFIVSNQLVPPYSIEVRRNLYNKIEIVGSNEAFSPSVTANICSVLRLNFSYICPWFHSPHNDKCLRMDKKIMKNAIILCDKRQRANAEKLEEEGIIELLQIIKQRLDILEKKNEGWEKKRRTNDEISSPHFNLSLEEKLNFTILNDN